MTKQFFTINEAAKLLGVSIKTLRRWETKGLIAPIRTVGNQRRYEVEAIYALTGKKSKTATRKEAFKQTKQLSLSQSALHLGISEKTLRRWEKKGIISSLRNGTNQKMFLFKDIEGLKEANVILNEGSHLLMHPEVKNLKNERSFANAQDDNQPKHRFSPEFVHFPTRFALVTIGLFASIVVIGGFGGFLAITKLPIQTLISHLPFNTKYQIQDTIYQNKVLQAATQQRDFALRINVPIEMLQTASVAGTLTAPNILYSVVAGDNITISGDPQNPVISASGGVTSLGGGTGDLALLAGDGIEIDGLTITNADTGSSQNIFSSIKIDSTTLSAGSNTDTFELAAGSNVTLSTDTSNKKITISASGGSSGITGLEVLEGGTSLSDEITALDFLGGDFDVGESPSGQANIQLAATLNSVTGVSGNFSIGGTTTLNGITYTWPGSEGSNYILQTDGAGILTWIDPGSLPNTDKWDSIDGALVPKIITQDLLLGGVSTESARFHVYGSANSSGTPVASISGNTSDTTFIVDNTGTGDLFEAASSGMARFVISQNGTLQMMGGSAFTTTLTSAATQNRSIVFPDADGTLCLSSGNCAGVGGNGDVIGPGSSTDHALVRFDGTTGKQLQNSGIIIDDSNNITGVNSLSILPASNITSLTLTGTNVTSSNLAYFNANNSSGTIFTIDYGSTQTLTGALTGQVIDLNNGQLTATNQDVTGQRITLPTVTNTNAAGTVNLRGLQVNFGSGAGINQNGAGATVFSNLDVQLPALTQTQGSLTANGLAVTTPSSITTGGVANGLLISPTGVGAGTLHGVNIATISASGNGDETALHVGSGWDTVLRVNGTPVINGQGVTLATGGGTGQSTYATGDILYASATNTLSKLAIGGSDDYVLKVSGGVPVWGTISGDSCTTCVVTNPSATATNTIAPTGQDTTGLIVRQTSTASPTNDIFQVTDSSGSNVYFRVDEDGNVYPSNTIGDTLTLTPQTDTTALTLVGTNVTTANLQYINANNQSGTIFNLNYGASQTLSTTTPLNAIAVDLSTNVTATNANVTATNLTIPGTTNTHTSGLKELTGVSVQAGGGINQNGAGGTTTFAAFDGTIPALTETAGTLNGYGVNVNTPSSITTGGTAAAFNVTASGVGAGTLYGLNISGITAGAGTETALAIGSGWDTVLNLNGTTIIDGSGNLNAPSDITVNGTSVCLESGINCPAGVLSYWTSMENAISPSGLANATSDLLIGGTASSSARFHVYGSANASATPVATVSGNTSQTAFVVDNQGSGELFRANSSGLNRFVINQAGNVGIGTANPSNMLDIQGGALEITGNTGTAIADTFTGTTQQSYIHFPQISGSNDPGFIMHETQGSGDTNEGVLHLSPSDDNGFGDYVSIHGTNDADLLKLHTDGTIEGVNDMYLLGGNIFFNTTGTSGDYIDYATLEGLTYYENGAATWKLDSSGDSYLNGGDFGIGTTSPDYKLEVTGGAIGGNTAFLPLYTNWDAYGTGDGGAGIYNDNGSYDRLMVVGNNNLGGVRRVGLWDYVSIDGALYVGGTADAGYYLDVRQSTGSYLGNFQNSNGGGLGVRVQIRTTGTPGRFMSFQSLNGAADYENGWIIGNGGGAAYNSASDVRLKENIISTHYGINDLMNIQVADFNYINSPNDTTTGFLAQQLYAIYPPAVTAGTSGNDLSVPWGVDYGKLTPLIVKGIQDQQKQLETLKASVSAVIAGSLTTDSLTVNNLQTQTLSLGGQDLNNRLLGLETGFASTSASFTTPLATQLASLSGQITSLTDKVASLEAQISLISQLSPIGGFNASSSAELALDSLEVNGNILTDSLNVLGYTTMNELSVTGSIRTGVLTINGQTSGGASISTLNGDLKLQDQGFGGIDILDGLVLIDIEGNIETQGTITAKKFNVDTTSVSGASAGQIIIPIGVTSYDINTTALTPDSLIFVTPNKAVVVGAEPKDANTFTIRLQSPQTLPIKVNWWIVN